MRSLLCVLCLVGCSGSFDDAQGDPTVADWGGPPGVYLELAPTDSPDSPPLLIEIGAAAWELRYGELWRTAQREGLSGVDVDDSGYWVGDSLMLPAGLEVGTSVEGTTVRDRGTVETWYGTFGDAITVDIGDGDFRGDAAFAVEIGPIALTWQGVSWELVYYERR